MSNPLLTIYHSLLWFLSQQRQRQCQANSKVLKHLVFIQITTQDFPKEYGSTTDNIEKRNLLKLCQEYAAYLRKIQMNKRKLVWRSKKRSFVRVVYNESIFWMLIVILSFSAVALVNFVKAAFVEQNYWVCPILNQVPNLDDNSVSL